MCAYALSYNTPLSCPLCNEWDYPKPSKEQTMKLHSGNRQTFYRGEKFICHLENKHKKDIYQFLKEQKISIPKCSCGCGNYTRFKINSTINFPIYIKGHGQVWNSGLNKFNNDSMKKLSEDRIGKGNPMFGKIAWNRGKDCSWFSKSDYECSDETRKKMSESAKNRKINGMKGKHHSEHVRNRLREKAINEILMGQRGQTICEYKVEEYLKELGVEYEYQKHLGNFIYDFSIDTELGKFLIEVHGDFWHRSKWYIRNRNSKILQVQKKNKKRDKIKKNFVKTLSDYSGLIIIWERHTKDNSFRRRLWKKLVKCWRLKRLEKKDVLI